MSLQSERPLGAAVNWLSGGVERGWRCVFNFLSSLLIPPALVGGSSHCPHRMAVTGAPAFFCPLSTGSCRAGLILRLVMVGRLWRVQSLVLAELQSSGMGGLTRWQKMRSSVSKKSQELTSPYVPFLWGEFSSHGRAVLIGRAAPTEPVALSV